MKYFDRYEWKPFVFHVMEREQAQKEFANGGTSINAKMRQLLEQNDDAFMTHLREYKSSDGMVTQDSEGTSSSGITEARDNATEGANNPKLRRGENPRNFMLSKMGEELGLIERLLRRGARPQKPLPQKYVRKQASKAIKTPRNKRETYQAFKINLNDAIDSRIFQGRAVHIDGHQNMDGTTNVLGVVIIILFCGFVLAIILSFILLIGRRNGTNDKMSETRHNDQTRIY